MIKIRKTVNNIIGGNMFQFFILPILLAILLFAISKIKIVITLQEELVIDIYIFKYIKLRQYKMNKDEFDQAKNKTDDLAKSEAKDYLKNFKKTDTRILIGYGIELLQRMYYDKINFHLNINVKDYILNSYIIASLNAVVATLISKNIEKINTDNLNYSITSNENKTNLELKCIMLGRTTNIIFVLIKVIKFAFEVKKRGNGKNGKGKRTSNRKFNGNSNVVAGING